MIKILVFCVLTTTSCSWLAKQSAEAECIATRCQAICSQSSTAEKTPQRTLGCIACAAGCRGE